ACAVPGCDLLGDELPLHAGRETSAAAATQAGGLHGLDDLIGRQRKRLLQGFVPSVPQVEVEREGVRLANVLDENWIHVSTFFTGGGAPPPPPTYARASLRLTTPGLP